MVINETAIKHGHKAIGFEINAQYCDIIQQRIARHKQQLALSFVE